jgi:hypothetical protein
MRYTSLADRPTSPSRILIDLAEGRLGESELDAVAAWLGASAPAEAPEHLVKLALSTSSDVFATVA